MDVSSAQEQHLRMHFETVSYAQEEEENTIFKLEPTFLLHYRRVLDV